MLMTLRPKIRLLTDYVAHQIDLEAMHKYWHIHDFKLATNCYTICGANVFNKKLCNKSSNKEDMTYKGG